MEYFSCLKTLFLLFILQKILAIESEDVIVLERKPSQIIHIDSRLTMTPAEEYSLNTLTNNLKNKRLNQYEVDRAFLCAANANWRCTMDFLLTPRGGQLSPSQCRINNIFSNAAATNNQYLVRYFLSLSDEKLQPEPWGINEALWQATTYHKPEIVELLLNASNVKLRPDKNGIGHAYTKAKQLKYSSIEQLLLPHYCGASSQKK